MRRLEHAGEMTTLAESWRKQGLTIGFVPTMGFLHDGHASLMRLLRPRVDRLVVSIYVNPLQFGPNEDLATYPRDMERDTRICVESGVDCIFSPVTLYSDGFSTGVSVSGLSSGLCGSDRPGHFDGVTTVVTRLFGITRCDLAAFGEKDFQQLMVIRRLVTDLALPVSIVPGPLVRDSDGLALSSRNAYLSSEERVRALSLHKALNAMVEMNRSGVNDRASLLSVGREVLQLDENDRLDYLQLVHSETLREIDTVSGACRVLVAARVGRTRLIDNMAIGEQLIWT